jgi:hypothetical protein
MAVEVKHIYRVLDDRIDKQVKPPIAADLGWRLRGLGRSVRLVARSARTRLVAAPLKRFLR